ncbi:class I adenylate-forming enzyme family protein [Maricaulis sp.]|uniref:class I adenylate-forming enzyme family protein n=1 Tax=Maricaulis sp. TaxID=1486257 RepID=UPI003A95AB06
MADRKPAPSRDQVDKVVEFIVANEPLFAVGEIENFGVKQRGYVNAPPDLRFLLATAAEFKDKTAVVFEDQRWTYGELVGKAIAVANGLIERHGVTPGTRVVLAMRNCPEWMACFLGIIAAGGVVVPMNGWWTSEEVGYGLRDSGAKIVIAGSRQAERMLPHLKSLDLTLIGIRAGVEGCTDSFDALVAAGAGKPAPELTIDTDSDFAIFYTSGSTGAPKGAVLTHRGAVTAVMSYGLLGAAMKHAMGGTDHFGDNPGVLVAVPLFHCTGSHAVFMTSLLSGRKMVLMRKWDAANAVDLIEREQLTNMVGVPTMSHEVTLEAERRGVHLDSLMDMGSGGAKRPAAHVERLAKVFPQAWSSSGYGLTETNALGAYNNMAEYQAKPGSCGRAVPAVTEIKIVRPDGSTAPAGEPGEVWIKSPCLFKGYLNQPEATAEVLTEDRWFKTGDVGVLDDEGFLSIVDRLKDMVIRGGENISCLEVEGALAAHPDIIEAAVIGIPDERLGERVGAAILLREGATLHNDEIDEFLKPHLAAFKRPAHYWRLDAPLPRGGTGKVDKPGLRKQLLTDGDID